jgi:hypothetical protein
LPPQILLVQLDQVVLGSITTKHASNSSIDHGGGKRREGIKAMSRIICPIPCS